MMADKSQLPEEMNSVMHGQYNLPHERLYRSSCVCNLCTFSSCWQACVHASRHAGMQAGGYMSR